MLLLAMDTSTSAVTAAVHDGTAVRARASVLDVRAHAEHLTPLIAQVIAEAGASAGDVTHVVAGTGPGPFTGLRVGLVTAQTFAFAVGAPCFGWSSLDALAHEVWHDGDAPARFAVATDARRKEVYWATYAVASGDGPGVAGGGVVAPGAVAGAPSRVALPGGLVRLAGPAVDRPAELSPQVTALPTAGRGPGLYPETFADAFGPLDVDAGAMADAAARALAAGTPLPAPAPEYLRRPDAMPLTAPKPVFLPDRRRR